MKKILTYSLITTITALALLTFFLTNAVIFNLTNTVMFDWFGVKPEKGNYLWVIVWANFISSILYLFSAYGLIKLKTWSYLLLPVSALILIIALIASFFHIGIDELYKEKIIGLMLFRIGLTMVLTLLVYLRIEKWDN